MTQINADTRTSRRRFLKGALVAGGAAGAAAIGGTSIASVESSDAPTQTGDVATSQGYRETAHVRNYYDKARF